MEDSMQFLITWGVRVISAIAILIAGWVVGNWTAGQFKKLPKLDPMLSNFLGRICKYAILAIAGVTVLGQFGVQTASLLAVLGAAGLAIGLALQGTLSNVAAGVMILFLRPFNVGDYIEFGGNGGTVKTVGLFSTELATPENVAIFAPNSTIWNAELYNYSAHPIRRQDINAGVSYSDDLDKAIKTIQAVLDKNDKIMQTEGKKPEVMISNMGESAVDIIARFWTKSDDYWAAKWNVTKSIKEALDKNGLTIPFPTRTVEVVNGSSEDISKAA